ncbi:MAG TPA: hypothetical protein DC042_01575 [Bacteroidales bacterium]|nr:hypothetical protein [Bacteroidales bacterium]
MCLAVEGQNFNSVRKGLFAPRDFGRYMISDLTSPVTKLQLGICDNGADYNTDPLRDAKRIVVEEITLGMDLPLYTGSFRLAQDRYRYSVATSLSSVIWFDFLNKKSSPVLNVNYRIGFPEIYIRREFNYKYLKNMLLRVVLLQHESTHIGDELTLYRKDAGFPITRINVSYESGEASLTFNDPGRQRNNNHSVAIGGKLLYKNDITDGYYTMQSWEGDENYFVPSWRRVECYLRYQYDGPASRLRIGRFYPVFSAELRECIRYGYSYYEADPKSSTGFREIKGVEEYVPCINVYAGFQDRGISRRTGRIGAYLHYYSGINPHGQFRNIPHYSFIALALVYQN